MSKNRRNSYNNSSKVIIGIIILIIALIIAVKLFGNGKEEPIKKDDKVVSVSISPKDDITVGVGYSTYLFAFVEDNPDAFVSWTSSDTSIATVYNGNVIGVKTGKVTITATYTKNGKEYKDSKEITVVEGNSTVTLRDVSFPSGELYMPVNSDYKLNLILVPTNSRIDSKVFESSDPTVATVNNDGKVIAHSEGHSVISVDVNNTYKKTIDVYVGNYSKADIISSPDVISFNGNSLIIKVGTTTKVNYSVSPNNISYSGLTWASSDPKVVTVDAGGIIKGVSVGTATISLSSRNGKRDDMVVEVKSEIVDITDISLKADSISMNAGSTAAIVPTVLPNNATNKNLGFTSSNNSVVSVSINSDGESATISALSEGEAVITINGGTIEKKVTVTVKGTNSNAQDDTNEDISNTIKVTSDKNNLATTYDEAKNIGVSGAATVTITLRDGVSKIKYCLNKEDASSPCTPNIYMYSTGTVPIPNGGIYTLRIKKYDVDNKEISSTSSNYIDGVLNYYINTRGNDETIKQYEITNAYYNTTYARANPIKINDSVTVKLTDNTRHLSICFTTGETCTPSINVADSHKMVLNRTGMWRIYIIEYDANNNKIGNTETFYAYVKDNETTNTNTNNNYQNTTSSIKVKASKLAINNNSSIGKYLSVNVESEVTFSEVRFCYRVVNKGDTITCDLNTTSSVSLHNGSSFFHPQESLKTYYGTLDATLSKVLLFDIDGLDDLYKNNDTNKDVILSFAIGSKVNNSMVYSNPIKVRMNMTRKEGINSFWSSTFIK